MFEHSRIRVGEHERHGDLCTVAGAQGLVVFLHLDGGVHGHRRSADLARRLQHRQLGTLLFDLLTPHEAHDPARRTDIELLTRRALQAVDALPEAQRGLPLGLYGVGAGAAAALVVDTWLARGAAAVVSRSGLIELAGNAVAEVRAPTLLIVGAADPQALAQNRAAFARLRCEKRIEIVPRASHLFMEAGALGTVAHQASDWFAAHLRRPAG
jgi:putative phosphoribosyl transferase